MKPVAVACGQVISGKEDVTGFLQTAGTREIGIVKRRRHGDHAIAPFELCCLVAHAALP